MVIVGSDYTDVATPSELSVNARIAANLGAPVVLAVRGQGPHARARSLRSSSCAWPSWPRQHAHTAAVVANRCEPAQMAAVAEALKSFAPKSYVLPEEPLLVAPVGGRSAASRRRHA